MPRPKGSKNKPKDVKEKPKAPAPVIVEKHEWAGLAPESKAKGGCGDCGHGKELHYGSQANWCNSPNCRCGAWKA